jgi:hypothetical protein
VDKSDEYTKKAVDSLPSRPPSIIANSKRWDKRKGWCGKDEGEEEVKGEVRHYKTVGPFGELIS